MKQNRFLRMSVLLLALAASTAALAPYVTDAKYVASARASAEARIAIWDVSVEDELATGYKQRIYPSASAGVQPFIFFPAGKEYWHLTLTLENASEVAAGCKFHAEVKHTPATAEISGGCTKAAGHPGICTNAPVIEAEALTAGYSYGPNGIVFSAAASTSAPVSCVVLIKIPRCTCTELQIYADFVQID